MNRLLLKKLVFLGDTKVPAVVDFKPGFNAITGASNTGKSLIFECINYALGASTEPKKTPEGRGYNRIFLTLTSQGGDFTIERNILSKDVIIHEGNFDDITEETPQQVLAVSSQAKENLSAYLLKIIGIEDKKLKKNVRNETSSLTFNTLRKLSLINEIKIQGNISPIYSGESMNETTEKSLFRFLLTGVDYSNLIVYKKPEIHKAEMNARIDVLEQLISKHSTRLKKDVTTEELEDQLAKLEGSIEGEITKISASQDEIEKLQEERKKAWDTAITADSKIDHLTEIFNRFDLLKKHYQSDLERLDAIIETGDVLSHVSNAACPLCGSEPKYHRAECVISETEIGKMKAACEQEKQKIYMLKKDLEKTIKGLHEELTENKQSKTSNEKSYKRIGKLIEEKLEPSVFDHKKELRKLFDTKKDVEFMIDMMVQIKEMQDLKATAVKDLKTPAKPDKSDPGMQTAEVTDFTNIIEQTLKKWHYTELGRVGFSESYQDITIGEKNRSEQGKGFRAITQAAFIVSLMDHCLNHNAPHPGFVVLDSPLVTYRGADNDSEGISDDMENQFYISLADTPLDRQVIVLENDDPPVKLASKIHYIHFTKNRSQGRYGFIPIG